MASHLPIGDVLNTPQRQLFRVSYSYAILPVGQKIVAEISVSHSIDGVTVIPPSIYYTNFEGSLAVFLPTDVHALPSMFNRLVGPATYEPGQPTVETVINLLCMKSRQSAEATVITTPISTLMRITAM